MRIRSTWLMFLWMVVVSTPPTFGLGHDDEIRHSLDRLEARDTVRTQEEAQERSAAVRALKEKAKDAVPFLIEHIKDKSKDGNHRDECLRMLSQPEFASVLTAEHHRRLLSIVEDSNEDSLLRIHAAGIILRQDKDQTKPMREAIKKTAFKLIASQESPSLVASLILRHYHGDADVEDLLLKKLKDDKDKNVAILVLGKIKSQRALDEIAKLVDSGEAGKSFYKVRAYLAMGEIGGERAFDYLQRYSKLEKNALDQDSLLDAMALTKTPRAKDLLIARLHDAGDDDLIVLAGFKYLGDPSTIPLLEKEMEKPKNLRSKIQFQKTIDALRSGDDSPPW